MLNDRRDLGSGREIQGFGSQASGVRRGLANQGQPPQGEADDAAPQRRPAYGAGGTSSQETVQSG